MSLVSFLEHVDFKKEGDKALAPTCYVTKDTSKGACTWEWMDFIGQVRSGPREKQGKAGQPCGISKQLEIKGPCICINEGPVS